MKFPIPFFFGVGCLIVALYEFLQIRKSEKVTGTLIGFEESSSYDPDFGMQETKVPVYQIDYHGKRICFQSKSAVLPMLRHDTKTFYVNEKEKVFEVSGAVTFLVTAVITIVIGIL